MQEEEEEGQEGQEGQEGIHDCSTAECVTKCLLQFSIIVCDHYERERMERRVRALWRLIWAAAAYGSELGLPTPRGCGI